MRRTTRGFCVRREYAAQLAQDFRRAFEAASVLQDFAVVDRERQYFLYSDDRSYAARLRDLVGRLLSTAPHHAGSSG
jgi:hypothetical protein